MKRNVPDDCPVPTLGPDGILARRANAQWAVVDVGAIAQLDPATRQDGAGDTDRREPAKPGAAAIPIDDRQSRHAEPLSGINRNYLVSDFNQLASALGPGIQSHIATNAVLTPAQMAALSPSEQQQLTNARTNSALLQTASQQAYSNASARFASIQQLINAIPTRDRSEGDLGASGAHLGRARDAAEREHQTERAVSGRPGAGVGAPAKRERASRGKRGELCARSRRCGCLEEFDQRFRPGAQCGRFCLGLVVTILSTASCAPAPDRAAHTVEEYGKDAQLAARARWRVARMIRGRLERLAGLRQCA